MKILRNVFSVFMLALSSGCGEGHDFLTQMGFCEGYTNPPESKYVLPWAVGKSFGISQGNCKGASHQGSQRYAYDVIMNIGTEIYAARSGKVIEIKEDLADGAGCPEANHVTIRHVDGSVAEYYHLTPNGALVSVNDEVKMGSIIAKSGNSGCSSGPHLHFVVWKDEARSVSIPITFRNASNNPKGLQDGSTYQAMEFWQTSD